MGQAWEGKMTGRFEVVHGQAGDGNKGRTPEYMAWVNMKNRCSNPNVASYGNYGGRGIRVCSRWLDSFSNFFEDMGKRPSKLHSIERRDNDLNYEPDNCYWATKREQMINRRSSTMIEYGGKKFTVSGLARVVGIAPNTMKDRLKRMSVEEAVCRRRSVQ